MLLGQQPGQHEEPEQTQEAFGVAGSVCVSIHHTTVPGTGCFLGAKVLIALALSSLQLLRIGLFVTLILEQRKEVEGADVICLRT